MQKYLVRVLEIVIYYLILKVLFIKAYRCKKDIKYSFVISFKARFIIKQVKTNSCLADTSCGQVASIQTGRSKHVEPSIYF